jgi:hypothetical protein
MPVSQWSIAVRAPGFVNRILSYFGSHEPRLAAAGSVALLIAGNQPFYPFYVAAMVGHIFWPALLTWLSTPFFLAVPAVCRRSADGGRWLLLVASIGNTVLARAVLGPGSGVELFYLPCLMLAPLLFVGRMAIRMLVVAAAATACGILVIHCTSLEGYTSFDASELGTLTRLHVFSVFALLVIFGFMAFRLQRPQGRF